MENCFIPSKNTKVLAYQAPSSAMVKASGLEIIFGA